jgi:hypothetical protein
MLKTAYQSIHGFVAGGWMSGSYTGAVLTEEYLSERDKQGNLPHIIHSMHLFR